VGIVVVFAIVLSVSFSLLTSPVGPRPYTVKTSITNTTNGPATVVAVQHSNVTQAVALQKNTINVVSTTSAFPFVQRWVAQYNNDEQALANVRISYLSEDDAYKIVQDNDMAILGSQHSADSSNNNNIKNLIYYIPVSPQAVAIVYNIPSFPDIPSGLKLNSSLLLRIFNGNITEWDDKDIKDLNENLNLPHQRIVVIHGGQNSISLDLLKEYLYPGNLTWPNGKNGNSIIVRAPDELASMIRKTPYSIGYVDFSYAVQTKMTFASVANSNNGEYILPSTDSVHQALNSTLQVENISRTSQGKSQTTQFVMINSTKLGNESYPIVGLYYAAIVVDAGNNKQYNFTDNRNATLDFARWLTNSNKGQQILSEIQYPPIYNNNSGALTVYAQAIFTKIMNISNGTRAL
jgi:ABC-type phosphate transport system substrate-binding protein